MSKKHFLYAAGLALAFASCKPHMDTVAPDANGLDFSRYIAVGNSLTAGYADGTLYKSGQQNSYPAILATQFSMVGGGPFKQPLLNAESGFPNAKRVLAPSADCQGVTSLAPILYPGSRTDTAGDGANIAAGGPYNNLGVPGIRAIDFLVPGYANIAKALLGVPYAYRFFNNPATDRPLDMVKRSSPSFFTAWIGNNDVLLYAVNGGAGSSIAISDPTAFGVALDSVVNALTSNGAEGALINIPDITAVPYFTTVPYNGLVLTRQGQVDSLNAAYAAANIKFKLGQNPFIIEDPAVPVIMRRQIKQGEYVLLTVPTDSLKCRGWGSIRPIPAQYVLTANEVGAVNSAIVQFNTMIMNKAASKHLAYVDMYTYMKQIAAGIEYNGVHFNAEFVRGGAFSLDGIHLTPRGYALAANEMIRSINLFYGSNIPQVDANNYDGVKFP